MKSLKKKRRIQIIIAAAVALVLAAGLIGYGFRDGINLYRSPSQMTAAMVTNSGVEYDSAIACDNGRWPIAPTLASIEPMPMALRSR